MSVAPCTQGYGLLSEPVHSFGSGAVKQFLAAQEYCLLQALALMNKRLCSIHCHKVRPCLPGQEQKAGCACSADRRIPCKAWWSTLPEVRLLLPPITGQAGRFLRLLVETTASLHSNTAGSLCRLGVPMQVIKLSEAVQKLPRETTAFVHGVAQQFLTVGDQKAQQLRAGEEPFTKGAYFIGGRKTQKEKTRWVCCTCSAVALHHKWPSCRAGAC